MCKLFYSTYEKVAWIADIYNSYILEVWFWFPSLSNSSFEKSLKTLDLLPLMFHGYMFKVFLDFPVKYILKKD